MLYFIHAQTHTHTHKHISFIHVFLVYTCSRSCLIHVLGPCTHRHKFPILLCTFSLPKIHCSRPWIFHRVTDQCMFSITCITTMPHFLYRIHFKWTPAMIWCKQTTDGITNRIASEKRENKKKKKASSFCHWQKKYIRRTQTSVRIIWSVVVWKIKLFSRRMNERCLAVCSRVSLFYFMIISHNCMFGIIVGARRYRWRRSFPVASGKTKPSIQST